MIKKISLFMILSMFLAYHGYSGDGFEGEEVYELPTREDLDHSASSAMTISEDNDEDASNVKAPVVPVVRKAQKTIKRVKIVKNVPKPQLRKVSSTKSTKPIK